MCRKNHMHGCCILAFALGLMVGHSMESWLLCVCGGVFLTCLGFFVLKQR